MIDLKNLFRKQNNDEISGGGLLIVSPAPHVKSHDTTRTIMLDVIIALLFPLIWAIYVFGFRSLTVTLVSIISCVIFEILFKLAVRRSQTVLDLSAVVTGMLLAFNLPATVSLWVPVIGAFFAIVIVKQLFGGIGMNIMNPALAARVFLFSWPEQMTTYPKPFANLPVFDISVRDYINQNITASATSNAVASATSVTSDIIASATPLSSLKNGIMPEDVSLLDLLIGNHSGVIGEIATLLLIAGGIYLIIRKIITWHIPVAFIGTVAIVTFFFNPEMTADSLQFMTAELLSGGLFLGAIFMATDYTTSPVTDRGRLIYGAGCGLITVLIRYFSGYMGGVSFAILIMNCLVWYIDKYTKPVKYGHVKTETEKVKKGGDS